MAVRILIFVTDLILVHIAFVLSFFARYGIEIPSENFQPYKDSLPLLTFVYAFAFVLARVFKKRFRSLWDLFRSVFVGLFMGTLCSVALIYAFRIRWSSFPSSVFVSSFPVALFFIFIFNSLVLTVSGKLRKKVVVIGRHNSNETSVRDVYIEKTIVDSVEDLVGCEDIDEVIVCDRIHGEKSFNLLIYLLHKLKTDVFFDPDLYIELISENFNGNGSSRFLATFLGKRSDTEEFLIRLMDVVGSLAILVTVLPVTLVMALFVKLTSPGPIFYAQDRVGKDGKIFRLFKFRTMVENAEAMQGFSPASENDPRITVVGRLLRRTRLDELPQLWNVLKGEISLVGPRPENLYRVGNHKALQGLRLAVKPGITGLAQVRSFYDLQPRHKIKYDYLYIQRRSVFLNLYILAKTVPVLFSRMGW